MPRWRRLRKVMWLRSWYRRGHERPRPSSSVASIEVERGRPQHRGELNLGEFHSSPLRLHLALATFADARIPTGPARKRHSCCAMRLAGPHCLQSLMRAGFRQAIAGTRR